MWRCNKVQKYLTNISAECGGVSKQYNHWSPFCQNFPTTPFLVAPQELHPALAIKKANFWRKKIIAILNTIKCLIPKQDCKYLLLCEFFLDEYAIQILHSVVALYLCKCWNLIVAFLFVFTFIFCWSLLVDIWSSDLAEQPSTDGADLSAHGTNIIL